MATEIEVKEYLAHWFQLGKVVVMPKSQQLLCPHPIFEGRNFSRQFEEYWQKIVESKEDCYLEGTEQTIKELLTSNWEMLSCARCTLPVPSSLPAIPSCLCPCADLSLWPNTELPLPHLPMPEDHYLGCLRSRLLARAAQDNF